VPLKRPENMIQDVKSCALGGEMRRQRLPSVACRWSRLPRRQGSLFFALLPLLLSARVVHPQSIVGWGDDSAGQISGAAGIGTATAMAADAYGGVALLQDETVVNWGALPPAPGGLFAIQVAAGGGNVLALRKNSTVAAWGYVAAITNLPPGLTNIIQVAAGREHGLALRRNGTVIAWGSGGLGQTNVPPGLNDAAQIAAGGYQSVVLRKNGTVIAWGFGSQTNVPSDLSSVAAIAAGVDHVIALKSNGLVAVWGPNFSHQTNIPPGLSGVAQIAAGEFHSLALLSNGTVRAWGKNDIGESVVPSGLSNVVSVAGGNSHSLARICSRDSFACREVIAGSNLTFQTSNAGATRENGEPVHSFGVAISPNKSIWYSWTAPQSGGVSITAASAQLGARVLAVYTGDTVRSLVPVARCASRFSPARVAFTAQAGQRYEIVLDGSQFGGAGSDEGEITVALQMFASPNNDSFTDALAVSGPFYTSSGSFLGASREPAEPNHGHAGYGQTLWWNWTAPDNIEISNLPVRLTADAVSFYPDIAVYRGTSVSNLVPVTPSLVSSQGMTRTFDFDAVPGTMYQIALGGIENDPGENDISPRFGNYRFRLNARALVLDISNLSTNTADTNTPLAFSAKARVRNAGSVESGPLRVTINRIPGVSVLGADSGYEYNSSIVTTDAVFSVLAPGTMVMQGISGTIPAPVITDVNHTGYGYGAYAELQEQDRSGFWHSVDQALIVFGNWPMIGDTAGPGGGVIRLDPGYLGLANNNPLASVQIVGPPVVPEGSRTPFAGKATFLLGQTVTFTQTLWNASRFAMDTNGVFFAGSVTNDMPVTLTNAYSYSGLIYHGWTNVLVSNLPPPTIGARLQGSAVSLSIVGVPGRSNRVEATTNLNPPTTVWVPLVTNAPASGVFAFTNSIQTNAPRRFYRVRELE
jgi:hypothetical protein